MGTASALQSEGVPTIEVSQFTGSPEILQGRVKTLHPKIHGGLLYVRGDEEHEKQADQHGIVPIDLVVVNLYPFEATIATRRTSRWPKRLSRSTSAAPR